MSIVAVVRCNNYDPATVKTSLASGIELVGGAQSLVSPGQKLLLKPNLLIGDPPEKCVTTHPAIFRAAGEIFLSAGAQVSYGDSPSFGSTAAAAKKAGLAGVAEELGIAEADFKTPVEIFYERGHQNKRFTVAKAVLEHDVIISLPKLKTHAFEKFTGCIKNQFGCIPGIRKGEYHIKLPDAEDFARMLVDLNNFVNPKLYIMDGIIGMEGNGPRGGTPRTMNVILVSRDPIALDATVCRIIGLDPSLVPTIRFGSEAGAGIYQESEIELRGDPITDFIQPSFQIDRTPLRAYRGRGITRFVNNRLVPRPYIIKEKCAVCGVCINMCPTTPKSIDWFEGDRSKPPKHNYKTCIRCYCCQELCPESAIRLRAPFIRRIFSGK